jgi:divalent metal cation (Fe/Co/Zn/Cd) transporter
MDVQLADITLHIDQNFEPELRAQIEDVVRAIDGVISFHNPNDRPHLNVVEYNPEKTSSAAILSAVTSQGVHAELIGL